MFICQSLNSYSCIVDTQLFCTSSSNIVYTEYKFIANMSIYCILFLHMIVDMQLNLHFLFVKQSNNLLTDAICEADSLSAAKKVIHLHYS
jgi:hypothetical protein